MGVGTWRGVALAALVGWPVATMSAAGPVEGTFLLVEQRYGNGDWNLASRDEPLRIEFRREGGVVAGRVWAGGDSSAASRWPAFANDAGLLPVEDVSVKEDASTGEVIARYRVRPSPTDDLVLEISESYRLVESGQALVGEMTVRFFVEGADRGGFALHRRFERER